jgi:urease accessory protein
VRQLGSVGRRGRLRLRFERRRGRTVLADAYAEPPLRVGGVFDEAGAASAILVCLGPGVFAGDALHQHVIVGPGARVVLQSQSALQVHPGAATEPASIQCDYEVADGGELCCQWDPVIPFAGARLMQRFTIRMAASARCYWADALLAGRVSHGERWAFAWLDHALRLEVDGVVRYAERYRLEPGERPPNRPWVLGQAEALATLLMRHEGVSPAIVEDLQRQCARLAGVQAGVDAPEEGLLVGRLLGGGGSWAPARSLVGHAALAALYGGAAPTFRR